MKITFRFIYVIIFLSINSQGFGCECPPIYGNTWKPKNVERSIEKSEIIFIGEVISSDNKNYAFKVLDVFKGNSPSDTIWGRESSSCSIVPEDGIWIVYSNFKKDGKIDIGLCGLSRSLTNMESGVPPPPILLNGKIDYNNSELQIEEYENQMLPKNLNNWINEYAMLIAYRNKRLLQNQNIQETNNYLNYITLAIACIALLFSILNSKHFGRIS